MRESKFYDYIYEQCNDESYANGYVDGCDMGFTEGLARLQNVLTGQNSLQADTFRKYVQDYMDIIIEDRE